MTAEITLSATGEWMQDSGLGGVPGKESFRFVAPSGGRIVGMRAWSPSGWISALQVLAVNKAGERKDSDVFGNSGGGPPSQEFVFGDDEWLLGVTGNYVQYIDNLSLHTSAEPAKDRLLGTELKTPASSFAWMPPNLPVGAEIRGLYGCAGNDNISAVGVICMVPGPPRPEFVDTDARWMDSTYGLPKFDDSVVPIGLGVGTDIPPHGNFAAPALYRVAVEGKTLKIWSDHGQTPYRTLSFQGATEAQPTPETPYLYQDEKGRKATVKMATRFAAGYIKFDDGTKLVSAWPYETVDNSQPTFAHVFSAAAEVSFVQAPFMGWDATWINPLNLQETNALRKNVFAYPLAQSRDYHASEFGEQKIVPNGLMFLSNIQSDFRSSTSFASSELDVQLSWKASFGTKVGIGKDVTLFKSNTEFRQSLSSKMSSAASSTLSIFTVYGHVLVVDLPRVALDDAFARDVMDLVKGDSADYRRFVLTYGTHFAYAITCGARSVSQMYFSKMATTQAISSGRSVDAEVGAVIEGITASANASASVDTSTQIGQEINKQLQEVHTVGGDASSSGHLALGKDTAVPILMDLRPLTALLNPVFFPEAPEVWGGVRQKLEQAIVDYGGGSDFATTSKIPPTMRVRLTVAEMAPGMGAANFNISLHTDVPIDPSGPSGGSLKGFDGPPIQTGFVPPRCTYTAQLWSGRLDSAAGKTLLPVTRYFELCPPLPPFSLVLQVQADNTPFQQSAWLSVTDFAREPRGGVIDFAAYGLKVGYQYQLIGQDFEPTNP